MCKRFVYFRALLFACLFEPIARNTNTPDPDACIQKLVPVICCITVGSARKCVIINGIISSFHVLHSFFFFFQAAAAKAAAAEAAKKKEADEAAAKAKAKAVADEVCLHFRLLSMTSSISFFF